MTAQIAAYGRIAADIQTKTTSHDKSMAFTRIAEGFIDGCLPAPGVTLEMDRYVQREPVGGA